MWTGRLPERSPSGHEGENESVEALHVGRAASVEVLAARSTSRDRRRRLPLDGDHVGVSGYDHAALYLWADRGVEVRLVAFGATTRRLSTPWLASQSRQNEMMSRLLLVETLGNATRRASISRGETDMRGESLRS